MNFKSRVVLKHLWNKNSFYFWQQLQKNPKKTPQTISEFICSNLGLCAGFEPEVLKNIHHCKLHFHLSQAHAYTVTGTVSKGQKGVRMSFGLVLRRKSAIKYTWLLSPREFFTLLHQEIVSPSLKFAQTCLCLVQQWQKKQNNRPDPKSNKGEYIPVFSIYIVRKHNCNTVPT